MGTSVNSVEHDVFVGCGFWCADWFNVCVVWVVVCSLAVGCVLQFVFRFPWLSYVGVLLFGFCGCLLILLVLGDGQLWLFGGVGLRGFACFWGLRVWGLWLVYASVCFVF